MQLADRIEIRGLRAHGYHGVLPSEQRDGQIFVVDCTLEVDLQPAGDSDDLAATVDYAALAQRLADAVSSARFDLIEALAAHLAHLALQDTRVRAATVRVAKPHAPVAVELAEVAVVVRRERG